MSYIEEPKLRVGIVQALSVQLNLDGSFHINDDQEVDSGAYTISIHEKKIILQSGNTNVISDRIFLKSNKQENRVVIKDVTIGIGFHWEQNEDQIFSGDIELIIEKGKIRLINHVPVEDYLLSVISSEMKATSSLELLKAHAIISRSWVLSQIQKNKQIQEGDEVYKSSFRVKNEMIRWYDREDHKSFDVCADDHCQRYQGVGRIDTKLVHQAIEETRGEVLMFNGSICDARFSKCCGGVSEQFENVWEPTYHPYLESIADKEDNFDEFDLEFEENSRKWITSSPDAFCNTSDKKILSQVLNNYDQTTNNFFRWKVEYDQKELSQLIQKNTKISFGEIVDLIPVERGVSGRMIRLKIVGTKATYVFGKELEIRRILSESHLNSSAFVVKKVGKGQVPSKFILTGAGWGHGVGLCQIGAAVMGAKGYKYKDILMHYFQNAELLQQY